VNNEINKLQYCVRIT